MIDSDDKVILVSACLLGVACRFNGSSKENQKVISALKGKRFVPICPESLSGLPVPREPAQFDQGDGTTVRSGRSRILTADGQDVSQQFLRGAAEALKISRLVGASEAILKDHSPSCGVYEVYSQGRLVPGVGVFAAMLMLEGVALRSEWDLE